jgi:hypothetical protein
MKLEKTVVEFLLKEIEKLTGSKIADDELIVIKAKEIFKNQIQNAFYKGIQEQTQRVLFRYPEITEPEDYYKNRFEK